LHAFVFELLASRHEVVGIFAGRVALGQLLLQFPVLFLLFAHLHVHVFEVLPQRLLHHVVLPELLLFLVREQERRLYQLNHVLELLVQAHHGFHVVKLPVVRVVREGAWRLEIVGLVVQLAGKELLVLEEIANLGVQVDGLAVVVDVLVLLALQFDVEVGPRDQLLVADSLVYLLAQVVFNVQKTANGSEFVLCGHLGSRVEHLVDHLLHLAILTSPQQLVIYTYSLLT
jgi:hypothetical protein